MQTSPIDLPSDAGADLHDQALRLLAAREHSRGELARKLDARGYAHAEIQTELERLCSDGSLNEQRLASAYVAERLGKGFGPLRIRAELRAKGLCDADIDPHLDLDDEDCLALMSRVDRGKFSDLDATDPKSIAKRARFLEYRGFPPHLIARILSFE